MTGDPKFRPGANGAPAADAGKTSVGGVENLFVCQLYSAKPHASTVKVFWYAQAPSYVTSTFVWSGMSAAPVGQRTSSAVRPPFAFVHGRPLPSGMLYVGVDMNWWGWFDGVVAFPTVSSSNRLGAWPTV